MTQFEIGKTYRMRDGGLVKVTKLDEHGGIHGTVDGIWHPDDPNGAHSLIPNSIEDGGGLLEMIDENGKWKDGG